MKTFLYGLALIFSVLFCFSSCSNSSIVGTWKVTDIQSDQKIDPSAMDVYKEAIEVYKQTAVFVYNADSTCEQTINGVNKKGTWSLLADGKQLRVKLEDNSTTTIDVQSLTSTEMILKEFSDGVTTITVYTKQN